jgi:hypothetical protein
LKNFQTRFQLAELDAARSNLMMERSHSLQQRWFLAIQSLVNLCEGKAEMSQGDDVL